jgi:hypothetical protein
LLQTAALEIPLWGSWLAGGLELGTLVDVTDAECGNLRVQGISAGVQEQEAKSRVKGLAAQKQNILAAKTVAKVLRSSLGPKGMDKMLQSPDGDVCISASPGAGFKNPETAQAKRLHPLTIRRH